MTYRPTLNLRCRNIWKWGKRIGVIEQLHVNDDKTNWKWVQVPLVKDDAPMEGEGPPPVFGDQQESS